MKFKRLQIFLMGILAMPMVLAEGEDITFAQSIYIGILRFFSGTLSPLIVLLYIIIATMILLSIGFLLKKVFSILSKMAG